VIERCPACGAGGLEGFHTVPAVPTNSCLLLDDARTARDFPCGRLDLAYCGSCGFITNRAFDPARAEYSERYEETQGYSESFVDFGRRLAKSWVDRYDLHGRHVLEVGCGKGEFLVWMMEAGAGSGTGIDPGVHPERLTSSAAARIEWVADFYDERWAGFEADALVCRHTLEHIHPVAVFLRMMRQNLGDRTDTIVLFELPDVARVLEEAAFWDTYYEHCSYFSAGSLARLFRRCGFEVLDVSLAFDDQYLLLEARPTQAAPAGPLFALEDDLDRLEAGVATFRDEVDETMSRWRRELSAVADQGGSTVVWGGGSKAVAFLTSLGAGDQVAGAVDINPHKQGRFVAGTGHKVLAPEELVGLSPDLVILANPVYLDEVRARLAELRVDPRVIAL
jgi:SAM-dependent methyltransferase